MKTFILLFVCYVSFCLPANTWAQQEFGNQNASLYFVKNDGQVRDTRGESCPQIEYVVESNTMKAYFSNHGVSYVFVEKDAKKEKKPHQKTNKEKEGKDPADVIPAMFPIEIRTHKVDMKFVGANENPIIMAGEKANHYCNYYLSNQSTGIERVPVYKKLVYKNVYDSIDVVFYQNSKGGIKYDIVVQPGGRVSDIKLKYSGANNIALTNQGILRVETPLGILEELEPFTYQEEDTISPVTQKKLRFKVKKSVANSFALANGEVRFTVGSYNTAKTLVIDPEIQWSTYLGGNSNDVVSSAISVDGDGNIVVRGETTSIDFPLTTSTLTALNGSNDAFVAKLDRHGALLWATYYGGTSVDSERGLGGVATDGDGNIFITGSTQSTSGFPATTFQTTYGGGEYDAYLAKLNKEGHRVWSTYYGGSKRDIGYGVAADSEGNVIIVGETETNAANDFPITQGAFQTSFAGGHSDGFMAKFSGTGALQWSTFIGGNSGYWEMAWGVTVDKSNDLIVTGMTQGGNFPVTSGAYQTTYGSGTFDGFVMKFTSGGAREWGTYCGGSSTDAVYQSVIDSQGGIIVVGITSSTNLVFNNACQSGLGGGSTLYYDAFVIKLSSDGRQQLWGTYYGGNANDIANALAIDKNDNVFMCGFTESPNFPTLNAYQSAPQGDKDAFVVELNTNGQCQWSTRLGGSGFDNGTTIGTDNQGNVIAAGYTQSTDFPTTTSTVTTNIQMQNAGGTDGFLTKFLLCSSITPPTITMLATEQPCAEGLSMVLDPGSFASYQWSNGATTRVITVTQSGTYTVTVTNEDGCSVVSEPLAVDIP